MKKIFSFLTVFICILGIHSFAQPFTTVGGISLDGFSAPVPRALNVVGTEYQLTEEQFHEIGAVWNQKAIDLNCNFTITCSMYFGVLDSPSDYNFPYNLDIGADGIGFVLQTAPSGIGSRGGGIGFFGLTPSFITEFDTYQNFLDGNPDPAEDHIAFSKNGSDHHLLEVDPANPLKLPNIEDGAYHSVILEWNATTKVFKVTFDGFTKSINIDLRKDIFNCQRYVYSGFTGATGWSKNEQKVKDIVLTQGGCLATTHSCDNQPICDYNILATKEAKFYDNNSFNGNVGVKDAKGKAEFKKNTLLTPGFVQAAEIKVDQPSTVPNQILSPSALPLPTVNYYAGNPDGYSNLEIAENSSPGTIAGNYKDVKVKKGATVTFSGTDFKKIEIDEGAKVIFTAATIDIKELKAEGKDGKPAKICFTNATGCTSVRIGYKVELGYYAEVNKGLMGVSPVVFYLANQKGDSYEFKVKKGSYINASAYVPVGSIKPEGESDAPTTMLGTYIAEKIDAGKYVNWLKGNCCFNFTPPTPPCTDGFVSPDPAKKDIVNGKFIITDNGATVTIRTILAKTFTDNTYGTNTVGWPGGHSFNNLVGSDKLQLALYNAGGTKSMEVVMDYISASNTVPSGYKTLGVNGGEGKMELGNIADVVNVKTSISENLNTFGYVLTANSPATDAMYTPNPMYPNWIFETWYEVTVNKSAFAGGFGYPMVTALHSSPSKTGKNSEEVVPCVAPRSGNNTLIVGVEEVSSDLNVKIAPNPSNSYFQLKLESSKSDKVIVRIMDAFGRPVKQMTNVLSNGILVIGQDLKPGNYFVEVIQGDERKVAKIVKL